MFWFVPRPATSDVWTGLTDLAFSGWFSWSDEHMVTFTYWAPGEPNNHDGFSEDCVEMLYQVKRFHTRHPPRPIELEKEAKESIESKGRE